MFPHLLSRSGAVRMVCRGGSPRPPFLVCTVHERKPPDSPSKVRKNNEGVATESHPYKLNDWVPVLWSVD